MLSSSAQKGTGHYSVIVTQVYPHAVVKNAHLR